VPRRNDHPSPARSFNGPSTHGWRFAVGEHDNNNNNNGVINDDDSIAVTNPTNEDEIKVYYCSHAHDVTSMRRSASSPAASSSSPSSWAANEALVSTSARIVDSAWRGFDATVVSYGARGAGTSAFQVGTMRACVLCEFGFVFGFVFLFFFLCL
jgi:hypothetical protein